MTTFDPHAALVQSWNETQAQLANTSALRLAREGRLTRVQYAAVLRQIFHQARENPQIQALATVRFRGHQRAMVSTFYRHAISEVGHDQLALDDIAALGFSTEGIAEERPLASTFALTGTIFHQIEHHDVIGYLGYLFHLEYTPTQVGPAFMEMLAMSGIPREAMGFIDEHAKVDIAHCKLMERYLRELVTTQDELDAVLYMQRATAQLYARMLDEAVASADSLSWVELESGQPAAPALATAQV